MVLRNSRSCENQQMFTGVVNFITSSGTRVRSNIGPCSTSRTRHPALALPGFRAPGTDSLMSVSNSSGDKSANLPRTSATV